MYGMATWGDAFTKRQLLALTTFGDLLTEAHAQVFKDATSAGISPNAATAYADAVTTYLAFARDKCNDYWSTIATWAAKGGFIRGGFARQAIQMTWDFAECNPFSASTANWSGAIDWIVRVVAELMQGPVGTVDQVDATSDTPLVQNALYSTDPPYYDNIAYAELSDYFYVWLRRSLSSVYPKLFSTLLTPKSQELVAASYRFDGDKEKAQKFFESGLGNAFSRMRENHLPDFPLTVYYAFKQSESEDDTGDDDNDAGAATTASTGWETMLEGLLNAQFSITGTWPVRTERSARTISIGTTAQDKRGLFSFGSLSRAPLAGRTTIWSPCSALRTGSRLAASRRRKFSNWKTGHALPKSQRGGVSNSAAGRARR